MNRNIWKILFLVLILINLIVILSIGYKILTTPSYDNFTEKSNQTHTSPIQVVANNETIEHAINKEIDENMHVHIDEDGIIIETGYHVLKLDIPVKISIEPLVKDDKIILQLKDIDVASLSISMDMIYDTLKDHVELGEGMTFSDDSAEIIIDSKVFKDQLEYDVTIDEIDYKNDKWYFSVDGVL